MKRRDLIKRLKAIAKTKGYRLETSEGGSHTKIQAGDHIDFVPRHNEISEMLAKEIIKRMERSNEN